MTVACYSYATPLTYGETKLADKLAVWLYVIYQLFASVFIDGLASNSFSQ